MLVLPFAWRPFLNYGALAAPFCVKIVSLACTGLKLAFLDFKSHSVQATQGNSFHAYGVYGAPNHRAAERLFLYGSMQVFPVRTFQLQ